MSEEKNRLSFLTRADTEGSEPLTVDDKIRLYLEEYAHQSNLMFKQWQEGTVHLFQVGEEIARLRKGIHNAEVGAQETHVISIVSRREYESFVWWKEAIDFTGAEFTFE